MVRSIRLAAAAIVLGTLAFGATGASANPFGGGHHGIHFGGWGYGWGHGWGYGWGHGWGYARVGYRPLYGGCYLQRYVNVYGGISFQRVCD